MLAIFRFFFLHFMCCSIYMVNVPLIELADRKVNEHVSTKSGSSMCVSVCVHMCVYIYIYASLERTLISLSVHLKFVRSPGCYSSKLSYIKLSSIWYDVGCPFCSPCRIFMITALLWKQEPMLSLLFISYWGIYWLIYHTETTKHATYAQIEIARA